MKVRLIYLLLIFILGSVYAARIFSLSGSVRDENGKPVENAQIVIDTLQRTAFSGENGVFQFAKLKPGSYLIHVYHLGYTAGSFYVNIPLAADSSLRIILLHKDIPLEKLTVTTSRLQLGDAKISAPVNVILSKDIEMRMPSSSAEILREETGIAVQKTNHGGGSAVIRGLSSSRILILIDGIRLNNSTYRLGNHQYLTTIDPLQLQRMEVIRGPGSALFGSDALGGVINTVTASLEVSESPDWQANIQGALSGADNGRRAHVDYRYANIKGAFWLGASYKNFGDLRRGTRFSQAELENSKKGKIQTPSGFETGNVDFKGMLQLSDNRRLIVAYQYNRQWDVPRYDKYENNDYFLWTYEPQERQSGYLRYKRKINSTSLQRFETTISYQLQSEGRNIQKSALSDKTVEKDAVGSFGLLSHAVGAIGNHLFTFGFDSYYDIVHSSRSILFAGDESLTPLNRGRYPDDARYWSGAVFADDQWHLNSKLNLNLAARFSTFQVGFSTDSSDYSQSFKAATFSAGLVYTVYKNLFLDLSVRQGFRAPNLSDLSKLGESKGQTYEVPNPDLQPENLLGLDLGIKYRSSVLQSELFFYFSRLGDLISSAPVVVNGMSQIIIDGQLFDLRSKQNIGMGNIYGIEWGGRYFPITSGFGVDANLTWSYGENLSLKEPMNSIPPLFGKAGISYSDNRMNIKIFGRFGFAQSRLSEDDRIDPRIPEGGTPAWYTVNMRGRVEFYNGITAIIGIENMLDFNYREHGSGINAAGMNFYASIRLNLRSTSPQYRNTSAE